MGRMTMGLLVLTLAACDADFGPGAATDTFGTDIAKPGSASVAGGMLRIALQTVHADKTYRLVRASIELSGAAMFTLRAQHSQDDLQMWAPMPTGAYGLYLRPGFVVATIDDTGRAQPVPAELITDNPFRVAMRGAETLLPQLAFRVAGEVIVFGDSSAVRLSDRR